MKKIICIAVAILASMSLFAQTQDAILSKIEKGSARTQTISGRFHEVRTPLLKTKEPVTLKGTLLFKPEGYLSMLYDNDEKFIIDGNKMVIIRDGQNLVFDLTKNILMRALSHTLIYSFQGKLPELAKEQDTDIEAVKDGNSYKVTLVARKKLVKGYNRIIVKYNPSTGAIIDMQMDEFSGATTYYAFD